MADLGNLGESELERWCHSTDLIINKSLISDKAGWDHIIDFPSDIDLSQGEVHASAYQCKVQVKATQTKDKKVQIKLSNLRRMVTDPIPNFILFLEYNKGYELETAYLRYVDKTLIERVLKKVHTLATRGSKKELKLHTKKMTIKFETHHVLTSPSGTNFKAKVKEYIGKDFQQCIVNKKNHLERVGFDGSPNRITFNTVGANNLEKLIDISLGREGFVDISELKVFKERFGQSYDITEHSESGGRLSMPDIKPAKLGVVTFKSHPFKAGFNFEVELFITPLVKDIKHKLFRYRLKSDFFEIIVWPAKRECKFKYSFNNLEMDIFKYLEGVEFMQELGSGTSFDIIVTFDDHQSTIGGLKSKPVSFPLLEESALLKNAISILNYFRIKTPTIINLDELFKYESSINPFPSIFDSKDKCHLKVTFDLIDGELNLDEKAASVGIINTKIGKHICSFIFVLIGFPFLINNKYELSGKEYIIEERLTYCVEDDVPSEVLKEILEKIENKYENEYGYQVVSNYKL